ncbi:hypothetical protein [Leuconostoc lactis]|uniref:hypothetical protein n=1 Tax=Leuconostoc lactis TaxID=1246 RepID=UPI0010217B1B|nr:hypothetical protein [Leuconostoc lactis]MSB65630.1 hypothetical protein [Leuconostoc lactis]RYS84994.1 hypothetical protein EAI73_08140 [Leuconostoc lactis]
MFGRKKQKRVEESFFARIEQSELSLGDTVIKETAEQTGVFESWPNVSLAGLQAFATALVNDVVRAGDHDIRLGNVAYFTTNEKGRASPTGLSWEKAILNAGFENIVVSTAEHIFNDIEIRQEEDMTYEIIIEAFHPLMDAAVDNGNLSQDDLPVLPTEEEFRQARETGEVLTVEPKKFQQSKLENVSTVDEVVPTTNDEQHLPATEPTSLLEPSINESFTQESRQTPVTASVATDLGEQTSEPDPVPMTGKDNALQLLIDRVNLSLKSFELTDVSPDLPAEDRNYVFSRLNADKIKANSFLNETSNIYTQKIRKQMADLLKQQQAKAQASIAKLRETDVSDTVRARMDAERASEYASRYTMAHQAREAGYRATVADEDARHENTLKSLKNSYVSDLEALKVSVNQELDNWFIERSKELLGNLQTTVENQVAEVQEQSQAESVTSLKALRDELLAQNSQSLVEMQQKLDEDINGKRAQYQEAHEKAVISATQLESAKTHTNNLSDLEQQIQVLKQSNLALGEQLKGEHHVENSELTQLRDQIQALQSAAKDTRHNESNQQLMSLLTTQMQPQPLPVKKGNPWQKALIGVLTVVAISSAGFSGYVMAKHHVDAGLGNTTVTVSPKSSVSPSVNDSASSSTAPAANNQSANTTVLTDRYHVGEDIQATINGKLVTAKVVSIQDKTITVYHDGYNYVVPIDN